MKRPLPLPNVTNIGTTRRGNAWFTCADCHENIVHVGPRQSLPQTVIHHRERDCPALNTRTPKPRAWTQGDPSPIGPIT